MEAIAGVRLHSSATGIGALAFAILPYDILHWGLTRPKASTNTRTHRVTLRERGPTSVFQAMLELAIAVRTVEDRIVVLY